jgi:hypothetical protein
MQVLAPLYKKLPLESSNKRIDAILWAVKVARTKIYEENSIDTYDSDWKNIGYTIDIKSLKTHTRVYLLNRLERELQIFQKDLNS